ncbi:hypothetical protein [Companilactobacillus ginsenosidimutans]|uniref:Uncharacterized protein n=1 Tax=Companilactobacillus ginsenosidimutans TaxID=1007676 RepID=A0A0H4QMM6_9LACO|nr:hypothetical protein [Companilactobacillus ginsenosidimutans]AKP67953.1 hypothetical protein ABM34_10710 [Companilactobacillus ginsenosidimutans]
MEIRKRSFKVAIALIALGFGLPVTNVSAESSEKQPIKLIVISLSDNNDSTTVPLYVKKEIR